MTHEGAKSQRRGRPDCVFCRIVAGQLPAAVVHEDDGMALSWPVTNPPREKLEEYAALIRAKRG